MKITIQINEGEHVSTAEAVYLLQSRLKVVRLDADSPTTIELRDYHDPKPRVVGHATVELG